MNGVNLDFIASVLPNRDKRSIQNHIDKQKREAKTRINNKLFAMGMINCSSWEQARSLYKELVNDGKNTVHDFIFVLVIGEIF